MQTLEQPKTEYKTCLITLVTPSQSDRVIKVYPAEHESEKIWLTNTQDIERWEAVERLLNNYAERGTRVPKPAPYHSTNKDLRTVDLKPEDIPLVRLDGAVLNKPKPKDEFLPPQPQAPTTQELTEKITKLESLVAQTALAVNALLQTQQKPVPVVEKTATEGVTCDVCNKPFINERAMKMHRGRFHKEA